MHETKFEALKIDDLGNVRPGQTAARERDVLAPLAGVGLSKG